jgi:hypothetical protein
MAPCGPPSEYSPAALVVGGIFRERMAKVILKMARYGYERLKEQFCEIMNSLCGSQMKPRSRVL